MGSPGWDSGTLLKPCSLSRTEALPPPSARCSCTPACLYELVITTLRKPDQPIVMRVGLPEVKSLWWIYSLRKIWNTLMGQRNSSRTEFWAGLIFRTGGNGPLRFPSSYRRRASQRPWPSARPGLLEGSHSPP